MILEFEQGGAIEYDAQSSDVRIVCKKKIGMHCVHVVVQ